MLIDNESEEGVLCQIGTLETPPYDAGATPFPLRAPTIPPPYAPGGLECAILAQFEVSKALESR